MPERFNDPEHQEQESSTTIFDLVSDREICRPWDPAKTPNDFVIEHNIKNFEMIKDDEGNRVDLSSGVGNCRLFWVIPSRDLRAFHQ